MTIIAGSGSSRHTDAYQAGRLAAEAAVAPLQGRVPRLIIVFTTEPFEQTDVLRGIRAITGTAALIGGCSGGLMTAQGVDPAGVAVLALAGDDLEVALALEPGLSSQPHLTAERAAEQVEDHLAEEESNRQSTALLFTDGLTGMLAVDMALQSATAVLGPLCPIVGGAAGDNLHYQQTYLFADEQIADDAVALALLTSSAPIGIGVRHGWKPVGRRLVITRSSGNIIYEIDGRPALDIYRDLFPQANITEETFREFTRYHPIGFPQLGEEFMIRLPLEVHPDGSIACAGMIPENAIAQIMAGSPDSLLDAAEAAATQAVAALAGSPIAAAIVIDCVTRPPLLGVEVGTELTRIQAIVGQDTPLIGMYSFGEVAAAEGPVCFHNKTVVVCAIGKEARTATA